MMIFIVIVPYPYYVLNYRNQPVLLKELPDCTHIVALVPQTLA